MGVSMSIHLAIGVHEELGTLAELRRMVQQHIIKNEMTHWVETYVLTDSRDAWQVEVVDKSNE